MKVTITLDLPRSAINTIILMTALGKAGYSPNDIGEIVDRVASGESIDSAMQTVCCK